MIRKIFKRSAYIFFSLAILVTINFMGISSLVFNLDSEEEIRLTDQKSKVQLAAANLKSELEFLLEERLFAADGLKAFVEAHRYKVADVTAEAEMFELFAKSIYESTPDLRSLQLAPSAIVSNVYPLKGNEKSLGHNLLTDSARSNEVLRSINNNQYIVTGPVSLLQGGDALIARLPIYKQSTTSALTAQRKDLDTFWGFATVLIDTESITNREHNAFRFTFWIFNFSLEWCSMGGQT